MRTSFLAQLCAALILASLFLPWFPDPLGGQVVPFRILRDIEPSQFSQRLAALSAGEIGFVASFALAALMLFFGFMGATPRLLAVLTGGFPVGLFGWSLVQGYQTASAAATDGARPDIGQFISDASQVFEAGAWLWLGAGGVLLLLGLFDRSPRRR